MSPVLTLLNFLLLGPYFRRVQLPRLFDVFWCFSILLTIWFIHVRKGCLPLLYDQSQTQNVIDVLPTIVLPLVRVLVNFDEKIVVQRHKEDFSGG